MEPPIALASAPAPAVGHPTLTSFIPSANEAHDFVSNLPTSPTSSTPQRPMSAIIRPAPRSTSRMSIGSKNGGSRLSDEDGRTSVKVAVRVRPPLRSSDPGYELIPQRFQRSMVQVNSDTSLAIDSPQGRKLFVFDRVFSPDVNQEGVWDYLTDSISSFTTGYNVSLLAYGQSGAGKSYTMGTSGPTEQGDIEIMGVIPRAATALFEILEGTKTNGNRSTVSHLRAPKGYSSSQATPKVEKNWILKATYVEIYNEQLRDLLIPESVSAQERATVTIREDVKGNIILTGLHQVDINSVDDLLGALNFGSTLRQTDATAINARSSRSHAVFSLNLVQRKNGFQSTKAEKRMSVPLEAMTGTESFVTVDSKFHFVDLAGSERLKNTGAQGERAKEGISINAGLAALGKVISQLSSRQAGSHVSYRDSRLTRLLQDSLGGNAITYMIACVTPAEFHLSETLNTVQYAQRARAIQSKPRIQQIEESDKQAIVDRLKAEVAFLREQIRSAAAANSSGERRVLSASERSERQGEREAEMQNALLDARENYTALSQRHAKLIAEMAKARDNEATETLQKAESSEDCATERLNRSNSFAHAVEQVVLEYEKTIQSLEQSLSSTRATLSSTETSLLEKESKCAYAETINSQLQARLQKLMDREANTENYLHDLESKLDGHTSGEEKNATIIVELRKEIARIRENEATCEDYISTLEERLAEADQDAELMQREIDRLEQVVERQRSLSKLDSLLYELDSMQQEDEPEMLHGADVGPEVITNGSSHINGIGHGHRRTASRSIEHHVRSSSHASRHSHSHSTADVIPEEDGEAQDVADCIAPETDASIDDKEGIDQEGDETLLSEDAHPPADEASLDEDTTSEGTNGVPKSLTPRSTHAMLHATKHSESFSSPAQSKFVADKLEVVTQELVDLRVEHEATVTEFDLLHAKYEEALRTLAELQDAVDEARHGHQTVRDSILSVAETAQTRPSSYVSDARSSESKSGHHYSSSRSLSSELSSALETPATMEHSDAETPAPVKQEDMRTENEALSGDVTVPEVLTAVPSPAQLPEDEQEQTSSPAVNGHRGLTMSPSTDSILEAEVERLRALAAEKEEAEKQLSGKYAELEQQHHQALDMVEELKTEVAKAQQAAEVTSPRLSTPVIRRKSSQNVMIIDRAHRSFASLRNIATENFEGKTDVMQNFELNMNAAMHELYARSERIQELEANVASTRKEMDMKMAIISGLTRERSSLKSAPMDMSVVSTLRDQLEKSESQLDQLKSAHTAREQQLQAELESLRASMALAADAKTAAQEHAEQVRSLELELAGWETKHQEALTSMGATEKQMQEQIGQLEAQLSAANEQLAENSKNAAADESAAANAEQQQHLQTLRVEIDEYKAIIDGNAAKVAELEASHASTKTALEEAVAARDAASTEATTHKSLVLELQGKIADHEKALAAHQDSLNKLHATHAREVEELQAMSREEHDKEMQVLMTEHAENVRLLESDLAEAREDLTKVATQVAFALGLDVSVEKISERIEDLIADQKALSAEQNKSYELQETVKELTSINDSVLRDLQSVRSSLGAMLGPDAEISRKPNATVAEQLSAVQKHITDLESSNKKNTRLVDELEEQLQTNFDQAQLTTNRLSTLQSERNQQLEEAAAAKIRIQSELESVREEYAALQARFEGILPVAGDGSGPQRSNSASSQLRKSGSVASLPSPPPAIPLPPLPSSNSPPPTANNQTVPSTPTTGSMRPPSKDIAMQQMQQDQEARIRTIEKHLDAEKQLTLTLEEALTNLEDQSNKLKADCDAWRRRAQELELENKELKDKPAQDNRWSLHQVEEERKKRRDAEIARAHLEERMNAISKKKKKGSLNCF